MFLTIIGFLASTCLFGHLGGLILWRTSRPPISFFNIVVFILFAHIGAIATMVGFGWCLSPKSPELTSTLSVVAYLVGSLSGAIAAGWLGAYVAATLKERVLRHWLN
jgi:hypothetical protein